MRQLTELTLRGGKAPRWLFGRMVRLSGAISEAIMDEYGPDELLLRLCDSNWFQALSCAIGYDWHSGGTTTVTMGALKEALKDNTEISIAGGKGKAGGISETAEGPAGQVNAADIAIRKVFSKIYPEISKVVLIDYGVVLTGMLRTRRALSE